jgi:hypothetical protein
MMASRSPSSPPRRARALSADEHLEMIAREFAALPGLRLTIPQACRLWSLERADCDLLFARLVDRRVLRRTADGCYMRAEAPVLNAGVAPRVAPSARGVA